KLNLDGPWTWDWPPRWGARPAWDSTAATGPADAGDADHPAPSTPRADASFVNERPADAPPSKSTGDQRPARRSDAAAFRPAARDRPRPPPHPRLAKNMQKRPVPPNLAKNFANRNPRSK